MKIDMEVQMNLCELEVNQTSKIKRVNTAQALNERLMSLGFIEGNEIKVISKGPRNNLTVYEICNFLIALRYEEGVLIEVDDK
jgi:ferrous iron transport protein A